MHRMFFAILTLWTSLAVANEHPGYQAYQAAEQKLSEIATLEKSLPAQMTPSQRKQMLSDKMFALQNQAFEQCQASISSYQSAPADAIDLSALYFCLVNSIENCEAPSYKPNCHLSIQSVLKIAQQQLAGRPEALGLHNLIGSHYTRQKQYSDAMSAYFPAYTQFLKTPCSKNHVNQLVTILNLHLENSDSKSFDQYWKMSSYCETRGLMQPRGTKIVRDTSLNRVTLVLDPSFIPAPVAPVVAPTAVAAVIPRELPAKIQPKPLPVQAKAAPAKKAIEEPDESEEEDIIASSEVVSKKSAESAPATKTAAPTAVAAAKTATSTVAATAKADAVPVVAKTEALESTSAAESESDSDSDSNSDPESTTAESQAPVHSIKAPSIATTAKSLAPAAMAKATSIAATTIKEESSVRGPAVANLAFGSVQDFVPGLLAAIAKNNPAWEESLTKRRASKNKSEKEAREIEEIFKSKKEAEKKAMDQMMSNDPSMRAKQLKNVQRLRLGDPMEKVKAALGKPTTEQPDQRTFTYEQLNTGATVGELLEGKMPPFIGLVFTFNPAGQLEEIKYAYPQGHGHVLCRAN